MRWNDPQRAGSLDAAPEGTRLRGFSGLPLNAGIWLSFGVVWAIGPFLEMPWHVFVAVQPAYVLIGFLLSLVLGFLYDMLGVGPASFGRSLVIIIAASYMAGLLWIFAFYYYRMFGAPVVHSLMIAAPSPLTVPPGLPVASRAIGTALPMFGWSLLRLGLQYNTALRQQREQALRAMAAARDAQLRMLAYQLNPHFLFNALNSIRALINEDPQRARDMVTALAGFLRYGLVEASAARGVAR